MQIKGEEFIRKVQIQQEREELERKLNELEEVQMSFNNNDPVIVEKSYNDDPNDHELDNIMLSSSNYSDDDNSKKKYLILGIILVVLFLFTIIIIRLLTDDSASKEDQFTTSSASSIEKKKLAENENIEENFQKIINERVKKDANEPMVPETKSSTTTTQSKSKTSSDSKNAETVKDDGNASPAFESLQKEAENYKAGGGISDEAMDQTIRKVEKSKSLPKEKAAPVQKQETVAKEEITTKKVETKKSIKDLVDSAPYSGSSTSSRTTSPSSVSKSSSSSVESSGGAANGYYIQIGAFTKTPTDSYVSNIRNAKLKYKVYQDNVSGTTYNKVLIGPYSSKAAASESVEDVKQKLNVTSAFVVKF